VAERALRDTPGSGPGRLRRQLHNVHAGLQLTMCSC
jgi:hypothetical protein